ncbi:hypothetical protein PAESOLCIP111_05551 [Paenibacillus solanacearum]|uniref:Uncharacterized protein n=1 Tax=Paenibacillus solanacearum TaxID=2048548 RepID=A0A916NL27_9BACL|nr:hypothetical protein [Paenibacillus solanacearum]CAG7648203.1 hypothetical protein PAESOLCIP111_05551 [Paenibacillus solanacearum]
MKPSELLSSLNLHDSLVNSISLGESELEIELELCNWKQEGFQETEEEMLLCQLNFFEVRNLHLEPVNFSFDSNEILEVQIESVDDAREPEKIRIVLSGGEDVVIIAFEANEVIFITK